MSVDFHSARDGNGPCLASLSETQVSAVNKACKDRGIDVYIDPWGDTKILDVHIARMLALPKDTLDPGIKAVLEELRNLEVVYAIGE